MRVILAEEGEADEHDIIDEEEEGNDAGDGDTSIEEEDADATPPRANLASTIALASANSFSYFMLGRLPICFLRPLLRLTKIRVFTAFISASISTCNSISVNKGILRHQAERKSSNIQA